MRATAVLLMLALGLGGCSVVGAGASVVGGAADITSSVVTGAVDVVTYPFDDDD